MLPLTVRLVGAITGRLGLVEARVPYLIDLTVLRRLRGGSTLRPG